MQKTLSVSPNLPSLDLGQRTSSKLSTTPISPRTLSHEDTRANEFNRIENEACEAIHNQVALSEHSHLSTLTHKSYETPQKSKWLSGTLIIAGHIALLIVLMTQRQHFERPTPKETVVNIVQAKQEPIAEIPLIKPSAPLPPPKLIYTPPEITIPTPPTHNEKSITAESEPSQSVAVAEFSKPEAAAPVKIDHAAPKHISAVEYIEEPQPIYPALSRRMGEEGRVLMQVWINDKGRAERVEIKQSSGFSRLDDAAKAAMMKAKFKPYLEDGVALNVTANASIHFSLRS